MDTTLVTLTGEEISFSVNALDFYSRIWIGQYDEILWNHRMFLDHKEVEKIEENAKLFLQMVRMLVLPDLGPELNGSYGIYNPDIDKKAQLAYNLQQVIRNKYAYARNPEGGMQVDFRHPMQCGETTLPTAEIEKTEEEWKLTLKGETEEDTGKYRAVLYFALTVYQHFMDIDLISMFRHYTNDKNAIYMVTKIQNLYRGTVHQTESAEIESRACEELADKIRGDDYEMAYRFYFGRSSHSTSL